MKRIFTFAAFAVILLGSLSMNAQNKFKGIVKYTVTSTGEVAVTIPEQIAQSEVKVLGDQFITNSILFTNSPMVNCIMQSGLNITTCYDFSQILAYMAGEGTTFSSYQGDGKMYNRRTMKQEQIDSLTIPCTEGFYVEYIADQTQKLAGYTCKLARVHIFDEEGNDKPMDFWYTDEIGPKVNFMISGIGINGMPLMFTQDMGGGQAITITATEVVKGKVKDVDFLMPSGFKKIEEDAFNAFMEEFMEELKYLQGGSEDE